jgi:methionyl-tRNA synthetase
MSKFFITTPIFYVNDKPHLGHAYTSIISDIVARFAVLSGEDVKFTTGTDEYGIKIEKTAKEKNLTAQQLVDQNASLFIRLMEVCNISNDDFIRTTQPSHFFAVEHFIERMWEQGFLYYGKYCGWYSIRDEAFFKESELTQDKKAPTGAPVEWIEEESIFFALSKFQKQLLDFYKNNPDFVFPRKLMQELISFVELGLDDLSISRTTFEWGIPMPKCVYKDLSSQKKHIVYVWLDALINYLTAAGYPNQNWRSCWPPNWQVIGKDILRFHGVYWPAFLMSADITPPKRLAVHGWWKKDGQKMSKSLGNVLDPLDIINQYGIDYFRYYCAREMKFGYDANFTLESFTSRINSELVNKIGNLIQRVIGLHLKIFGEHITNSVAVTSIYQDSLIKEALLLSKTFLSVIESFEYQGALEALITLATNVNKYLDTSKPWKEQDKDKVAYTLFVSLEIVRYLGICLQPFIPSTAKVILDLLSIPEDKRKFCNLNQDNSLSIGTKIKSIDKLFTPIA